MSDIMNRVRKVDVNNINVEEIQNLTEELSKQINMIVDVAVSKANMLLNIYGLETKMQIVIQKKEDTNI